MNNAIISDLYGGIRRALHFIYYSAYIALRDFRDLFNNDAFVYVTVYRFRNRPLSSVYFSICLLLCHSWESIDLV